MKNKISLIFLLFTELICFTVTRISLFSYINNEIYFWSMNFVQFLYFLPVLLIALYFFISTKSDKRLLVNSTIGLILYAIILHIFMVPIVSLFTNKQGIVNFTEYTWKIYSICLPLVGIRVLGIKKSYFLFVFRIILLFIITLVFKKFFALKGTLYAWPLCEIIYILFLFIRYKKRL